MPKGLPEDGEVVTLNAEELELGYRTSIVQKKNMIIHAITPSNAHSPIKVLYLLKNGLWMIVLNLSINFIIESTSVYGAKLHKNGDFYAS